jgi:hypothetical protein
MLVLAAKDDLVPSALVRAMLIKKEHPCEARLFLLLPHPACILILHCACILVLPLHTPPFVCVASIAVGSQGAARNSHPPQNHCCPVNASVKMHM